MSGVGNKVSSGGGKASVDKSPVTPNSTVDELTKQVLNNQATDIAVDIVTTENDQALAEALNDDKVDNEQDSVEASGCLTPLTKPQKRDTSTGNRKENRTAKREEIEGVKTQLENLGVKDLPDVTEDMKMDELKRIESRLNTMLKNEDKKKEKIADIEALRCELVKLGGNYQTQVSQNMELKLLQNEERNIGKKIKIQKDKKDKEEKMKKAEDLKVLLAKEKKKEEEEQESKEAAEKAKKAKKEVKKNENLEKIRNLTKECDKNRIEYDETMVKNALDKGFQLEPTIKYLLGTKSNYESKTTSRKTKEMKREAKQEEQKAQENERKRVDVLSEQINSSKRQSKKIKPKPRTMEKMDNYESDTESEVDCDGGGGVAELDDYDSDYDDDDNELVLQAKFIEDRRNVYYPVVSKDKVKSMKKIIVDNMKKTPRPYRKLSEFLDKEADTISIPENWILLFDSFKQFTRFTKCVEELKEISPDSDNPIIPSIKRDMRKKRVDEKLIKFSDDSKWVIENYDIPDLRGVIKEDNTGKPVTHYCEIVDPDGEQKEDDEIQKEIPKEESKDTNETRDLNKGQYFTYISEQLREQIIFTLNEKEEKVEQKFTDLNVLREKLMKILNIEDEDNRELYDALKSKYRNLGNPNTPGGTYFEILDYLRNLKFDDIRIEEANTFAEIISTFIVDWHKRCKTDIKFPTSSRSNKPCPQSMLQNLMVQCDTTDKLPNEKEVIMDKMVEIWTKRKTKYIEERNKEMKHMKERYESADMKEKNVDTDVKRNLKQRNWMLEIVRNLENFLDRNYEKIDIDRVDIFDQINLSPTSLWKIIHDTEEHMKELENTGEYNTDCNQIGHNGTRYKFVNAISKIEECFIRRIESLDENIELKFNYDETINYAMNLACWVFHVLNSNDFDIRIGTIHFGVIAGKMKENSIWKCKNNTFVDDDDNDGGFQDGFGIFLSMLKRDNDTGNVDHFKIKYRANKFDAQAKIGENIDRIVDIDPDETKTKETPNPNLTSMKKIQGVDNNYYLINVQSWLKMFKDGLQRGIEYKYFYEQLQYRIKSGIDEGGDKVKERVEDEMEFIEYRIIGKINEGNKTDSQYQQHYADTSYRLKKRREEFLSTVERYAKIKQAIVIKLLEVKLEEYDKDESLKNHQIENILPNLNNEGFLRTVRLELENAVKNVNNEKVKDKTRQNEELILQSQRSINITKYEISLIECFNGLKSEQLFPSDVRLRRIFEDMKLNKRLYSLVMGIDTYFEFEDDDVDDLLDNLVLVSQTEEKRVDLKRITQGIIAGFLDSNSAEIYGLVEQHNIDNPDNIISTTMNVSKFFQKHLVTPKQVYDMYINWEDNELGFPVKNPVEVRKLNSNFRIKFMKILWGFEDVINGMVDCIEYFLKKSRENNIDHETAKKEITDLYNIWKLFSDDKVHKSEIHFAQLYTKLMQKVPGYLEKIKQSFSKDYDSVNSPEIKLVHSGEYKSFRVQVLNNHKPIEFQDGKKVVQYYSCKIIERPPDSLSIPKEKPVMILKNCFYENEDEQEQDKEKELEMYNDRHKVRIASWNVACANNLEKPSNKEDYDKKIENMATIICESKGDIIALQELPNEISLKDSKSITIEEFKKNLIEKVNEKTKSTWQMQHATVFHSKESLSYEDMKVDGRKGNGPKEVYAFLYNDRVKYLHANPHETNKVEDFRERDVRFSRLPIISNFLCGFLEFTLCTVHLPPYQKKVKTSQEIKDLGEKVFPELIKVYGDKKNDSVIFLGDFNMCYTKKKGFEPKPEVDTWDAFSNAGYIPCIKACTNVLQTQRFDNIWIHHSVESLRMIPDDETGYTGVVKINEKLGRPIMTGAALKEGFKKEASDHNLVYIDLRVDELMPWSSRNIQIKREQFIREKKRNIDD